MGTTTARPADVCAGCGNRVYTSNFIETPKGKLCFDCLRVAKVESGKLAAPAPRIEVEALDTPRKQAERIVKAWRATDQHDQLLVHYIRQAIEDNVITRHQSLVDALRQLRDTSRVIDGDMWRDLPVDSEWKSRFYNAINGATEALALAGK